MEIKTVRVDGLTTGVSLESKKKRTKDCDLKLWLQIQKKSNKQICVLY